LLAELEEQKSEIEEKKNHLTRVLQSITQASRIQMALMHSEKDLQDIFPNSFLLIKPKDIVSGDFLWIGRRPGRVFVAVADCTGHGVPGAFMSMMGKLILNQVIIEIGLDDIVSILNAVDAKVNKVLNYSAEGMELGILKFMTDENKIEFAGAHRPLCFTENNEIIEIKGENNGVGGFHKNILKYFKKHELYFKEKGKKRLYLYSDGFPDQIGGDSGRKLTNNKFKKILEDTSKLPIMQQKQELESQLLQWQGRHKQTDDVIVVAIEIE
jgi:serine phosphatase RsbU (regulator of sigma subunit)